MRPVSNRRVLLGNMICPPSRMNDCNETCTSRVAVRFRQLAAENVDNDELKRPAREKTCTERSRPSGSDLAPNSLSANSVQEPPSFGFRGSVKQLACVRGSLSFRIPPPTQLNLLLFRFYVNGKPSTLDELMSRHVEGPSPEAYGKKNRKQRRGTNNYALA